jgi:DNA-binding MarR family transcriptional regulator
MTVKKSINDDIARIATDMRAQHSDVTVHTFLLIESTYDVINRYFNLCSGQHAVSQSGLKVLNMLILHGGGMIQTEISKKVFRSKHSVSKVVYTLENHGLVKIHPVGDDRRKKEVRITPKGMAVAEKGSIYARERISKEVLAPLNKKERTLMHDMLKRIREHTLNLIAEKSDVPSS